MRRWIGVAALAALAAVGLFLILAGDSPVALSRADLASPPSPWLSGGPNGPGGSPLAVSSLAASPSYAADQTLLAATDNAIHRSQDGGLSWQAVLTATSPAAGEKFSHVRLSPDFAGDHIAFAGWNRSTGSTLYKSSDGGQSWQTSATFTETLIALRLSTDFPIDSTLFALLGDGTTLGKSIDGGLNWTRHSFNVASPPNGFDIGVIPDYDTHRTLYVSGFGQTIRSVDGGANWSMLPSAGPTYAIALSPDFLADQTLWQSFRAIESAGDGLPEADVLRSADGGASWFLSSDGLPGVYEPFPRHLAVSPRYAQDSTLFTALSGQFVGWQSHDLFCSYDGGRRWHNLGPVPGNPDVTDLAVSYAAGSGLTLHVASGEGVWQRAVDCPGEANIA